MNDIEAWSLERLKNSLKDSTNAGNDFPPGRPAASGAAAQQEKSVRTVGRSGRCQRLAVAAFVGAGSLWGAAFLFGKLAFTELPISHVALYRFTIAALVLLPFALVRRIRPRRKDILHFLLTGFLIAPMTFMLQYRGLALTSASSASLIIGTFPPMMALAAMWFLKERLNWRGWASIGISTLGVLIVVGLPSADHNWTGDALVFLSMIVVAAWVLLSKPLIKKYTALGATAYLMLFGTLTMLPISLISDGPPRLEMSSSVMASVITLGLACSALTYVLWNWGINYVSASHAGIYTNIEPVVGVLLSVIFLHESLKPGAIVGGLLIISGAIIISRQEKLA
ncbi:MAG TPA: EamA family transporter [Pyrinomonadaceae bacterium]|nr:EamA family transporter [Pyrinomonadaceae bacterium]